MGQTPKWTIAAMIVCTLLLSAGQLLLKMGAKTSGLSLIIQPLVISGFLLLCIAGLIMTMALKHGELSVLYPIIALGFVWVMLVSAFFLGETPNISQIIGIIAIITGVSLIGHKGSADRGVA